MNTNFWGPHGWIFIHSIANNYANLDWEKLKEEDKIDEVQEDYEKFFHYLGKVLPCRYCRKSYNEYIKELPIKHYLNGPDDLLYWTYCIHNKVNDKLRSQGEYNKPNPSFDLVCKRYKSKNAKSCINKVKCKPSSSCSKKTQCTVKPYQKIKYSKK